MPKRSFNSWKGAGLQGSNQFGKVMESAVLPCKKENNLCDLDQA